MNPKINYSEFKARLIRGGYESPKCSWKGCIRATRAIQRRIGWSNVCIMSSHIEMMNLAESVAKQSVCPERQVGVTILRAGEVQPESTYNTSATDDSNGHHAEARLISWALKRFGSVKGATLYTTCRPCVRCTAMLLPLGLKAIYYRDKDDKDWGLRWLAWHGVQVDSGWIQGQIQQSWAEHSGQSGVVSHG